MLGSYFLYIVWICASKVSLFHLLPKLSTTPVQVN